MAKHRLLVFHKLQSYQTGAEEVTTQLRSILRDTKINGNDVTVQPFSAHNPEDDLQFLSTSVAIVLDARQTRALITPERRDANVDHWDELAMLATSVTKPKGSVLLVIYRDESSKQLNDESLISDEWTQTWQYNDTVASNLAEQGRCFTLWTEFNTKQAGRIQEYIASEASLYAGLEDILEDKGVTKRCRSLLTYMRRLLQPTILAVVDYEFTNILHRYLITNPFTAYENEQKINEKVSVRTYSQKYLMNPQYSRKRLAFRDLKDQLLTVFMVNVASTQYCKGRSNDTKHMTTLLDDITRYRVPSIAKTLATPIIKAIGLVGINPLSFDKGLVSAHCDVCYDHLISNPTKAIEMFGEQTVKKTFLLSSVNNGIIGRDITPLVGWSGKSTREPYDVCDGTYPQSLYGQLRNIMMPIHSPDSQGLIHKNVMEFVVLPCLYVVTLLLIICKVCNALTRSEEE